MSRKVVGFVLKPTQFPSEGQTPDNEPETQKARLPSVKRSTTNVVNNSQDQLLNVGELG